MWVFIKLQNTYQRHILLVSPSYHTRLKWKNFRVNRKKFWKVYVKGNSVFWLPHLPTHTPTHTLYILHWPLGSPSLCSSTTPHISSGVSQTAVIYPEIKTIPRADKWHLQCLRTSQDVIASPRSRWQEAPFLPPHPLLFFESKPQGGRHLLITQQLDSLQEPLSVSRRMSGLASGREKKKSLGLLTFTFLLLFLGFPSSLSPCLAHPSSSSSFFSPPVFPLLLLLVSNCLHFLSLFLHSSSFTFTLSLLLSYPFPFLPSISYTFLQTITWRIFQI